MGFYSMLVFLFSLLALFFQFSHASTITVDGVSQWRNPSVQVGDSVIFQHKYHYNLYIFQNQRAFNLCNFTHATLHTKQNSNSFTWHPSRPGFFYFSFNNGSAQACQEDQRLAIKVSLLATIPKLPPTAAPPLCSSGSISSSPAYSSPPENSVTPPTASPPLSSDGSISTSPAYPWPFQPRESNSPSPSPSAVLPAMSPLQPDKNGAIPFINSNPAVPLPSGEVDSATIRPLPSFADHPWRLALRMNMVSVSLDVKTGSIPSLANRGSAEVKSSKTLVSFCPNSLSIC